MASFITDIKPQATNNFNNTSHLEDLKTDNLIDNYSSSDYLLSFVLEDPARGNIWDNLIIPDLNSVSDIQPLQQPAPSVFEENSRFAMEQIFELPVGMRSPDSGIHDLAEMDRESPMFGDVLMSTDSNTIPLYTDAMLTSNTAQEINLDFDMLKDEDLFDIDSLNNQCKSLDNNSSVYYNNSTSTSPAFRNFSEKSNYTTKSNIKSEPSTNNYCGVDRVTELAAATVPDSSQMNTPVRESNFSTPNSRCPSPTPSASGSDWSVDVKPAIVRRNRKKLTAEQVLKKTAAAALALSPSKKRKQERLNAKNARKLKLYEVNCPLNNPEAEKCRLNAINAKKNRDKKKMQLQEAQCEISELRRENAELREQAENVREELDHALSEIQELKMLMKMAGLPVGNKRAKRVA